MSEENSAHMQEVRKKLDAMFEETMKVAMEATGQFLRDTQQMMIDEGNDPSRVFATTCHNANLLMLSYVTSVVSSLKGGSANHSDVLMTLLGIAAISADQTNKKQNETAH